MPNWSRSLPPRHSATGQFTCKTVSFAPQPSDTLVVSTSLEPAATSSPRSALGLPQLPSPKGISSPLTLLPPMTEPRDEFYQATSPSFRLRPVFNFGLIDDLSEPWTPPISVPEPPLTPVHDFAPCRSSPLPQSLLPVDAPAGNSLFASLATHFAAPVLLHPHPVPPASQPSFLPQPTSTFVCALPTTSSMANSSHISGPAAMPRPCSNATPLFSGTLDDPIDDFLTEYSELADSHGLSE
jgi:hypothetical protein